MPKRGQTLTGETREIVIKLQDYFKRERRNGGPLVPVKQVQERVAQALDISKRTITNINKEKFGPTGEERKLRTPNKKRRSKPVTDIDNFDADAIRDHIYSHYIRNEYLNRSKLWASLKEAGLFNGGKTALSTILKDIGFQNQKVDKKKVLLERFDTILKRVCFLREAKTIENWDNVVFIDETWLNINPTLSTSTPLPMSKGGRLIIFHAGSAKCGFIENGLMAFESKSTVNYREEINAVIFKEWFQNVLLPGLSGPSVIIMDNTPYHSVQIDKAPTQASRKEEMVDWLLRNGIETNIHMLKVELIKLIKENKPAKVRYEIDELALAHGHRILRTPPCHCRYNAMKLIWAQIKAYAASNNTAPPFDTRKMTNLLLEACRRVTKDDWKKVTEKTKNKIFEDYDRDIRMDTLFDNNLIIQYICEDDSLDEYSSESESD